MLHACAGAECVMQSNAEQSIPILEDCLNYKDSTPPKEGYDKCLSTLTQANKVDRFARYGAVTPAGRSTCPGLGSAAAGAALLPGAQRSPLLSAEAPAAAVESPGNMQQCAQTVT